MTEKQQKTNDEVLLVYMKSGLSMDEIISSLNHLLTTAKWSKERVDNE